MTGGDDATNEIMSESPEPKAAKEGEDGNISEADMCHLQRKCVVESVSCRCMHVDTRMKHSGVHMSMPA